MSKRHADSTPDEKPAKRRRCEADEVSALAAGKRAFAADPYDAVCCMCRDNQQDSLRAILAQHFAPDTRNAGAANVSARGGETERTVPALLDACDDTGRTPLMICACKGHVGCLVLLLEAGAGLDVVSPDGNTALHLASFSKNNQADLVNMLLKHGASIEARNNVVITPLLVAIAEANEPAVVALLEGGASLATVDNDSDTALHYAARLENNQAELVNILLKHGASVETPNEAGVTPLHMAVAHANEPAVVALLEGGASLATVDSDGDTALHHAAFSQTNQADLVNMLLKHGASIEARNNVGATPLLVAIGHDNEPAAVALLEGGASLATVDSDGNTALHYAASLENNQAELVNMLLKHGASIEARNNVGVTPLHAAIGHYNEPAAVALLEGGASLATVDSDGNTALHYAASLEHNQAELVNILLKHGVSVEARNNVGATPLLVAIGHDSEPAVVPLLEGGASLATVDSDGNTALHYAARLEDNQADLVNILLKHGASVETPNEAGVTPLHVAVAHANEPAAVALLEGGASLATVDSDGDTALHHAAFSQTNQADLVNMLLKHGVSVEARNNVGATPLHAAIGHANEPAVVALLSRGASLTAVDSDGNTALHHAAFSKNNQADFVNILLKHGASVETPNEAGVTPLHMAIAGVNEPAVVALLEGGASLATVDSLGNTALHHAAISKNNQAELVNMLLKHGASVETPNEAGITPLHMAVANANEPAVVALLEGGASLATVDSDGNTALDYAARLENNQAELVNMLLKHGASVEAVNK